MNLLSQAYTIYPLYQFF